MYILSMSQAQMDVCNRAADREVFAVSTMFWGKLPTSVVLATRDDIETVITALPDDLELEPDDGSEDWSNIALLKPVLRMVIRDGESGPRMLHGVQI